ncbi:MAG: hypothetical protein WC314_12580 [Vulcanimicrobiota bacterium]
MRIERNRSRGMALAMFLTLLVLILLLVMALSVLNVGQQNLIMARNGEEITRSFYLAEAGIQDGLTILKSDPHREAPVDDFPTLPLLSKKQRGDSYRLEFTNNFHGTTDKEAPNGVVVPPGYCQILSIGSIDRPTTGNDGDHVQRIAVMVRQLPGGFFHHAVFAGNRDETEEETTLRFRGNGDNSDSVKGPVHSNRDLIVEEQATIDGAITAGGAVIGVPDVDGGDAKLMEPDLDTKNYETSSHINVAQEFARSSMTVEIRSEGSWMNDTATTVAPDNPAHIFAKDVLNDLGTADDEGELSNDNYYLADYHQSKEGGNISTDTGAHGKTYFVDGNLWIESFSTGGWMDGQSVIVVKGNIYVADTVSAFNADSALVLVAMADGESYTDLNRNERYDPGEPIIDDNGNGQYDGNVEGSGNIFFGDPNVGPVGDFDAFMYAENNFEDYAALVANWSQEIKIHGSMSAGNRINLAGRIEQGAHVPITIDFDSRISDGTLKMEGIPNGASGGGDDKPIIVSWRRG